MYRRAAGADLGSLIVPAHHVFVLGDNRGSSADSRYIGFIAADSVVARPTLIYFSRDVDSGKIRWSRIGRGAGEQVAALP